MAAINNANNRDIESQDLSTVSRKDSETYQSTVLPASAIDFDPEPHKLLFRQFANPAPLGLCGFALTTFVLSLINVQARSVGHRLKHRNRIRYFSVCLILIQRSHMAVLLNCSLECGSLRAPIRLVLLRLAHTVPSGFVSLPYSSPLSAFYKESGTTPRFGTHAHPLAL